MVPSPYKRRSDLEIQAIAQTIWAFISWNLARLMSATYHSIFVCYGAPYSVY